MASRFWVGGTGNWDAATTTNWSATTGGAGGASVPTAADDVFLDGNSGVGVISTIGGTALNCRNLDCTGYAGTLTLSAASLNLSPTNGGGLTLSATMTINGTFAFGILQPAGGTCTVITAGKTMPSFNVAGSTTGTVVLGDAFTGGSFTLTSGILNTNGKALNIVSFSSSNANVRTITMGASAITVTGAGTPWDCTTPSNLTITANTATITLSGASVTWRGGGQNWNGLSLVFTGGGVSALGNGGTYANVTYTGTAVKTNSFNATSAVTTTVTGTLTITGPSAVNRVFSQGVTLGSALIWSLANAPTLTNVDFMDVSFIGAASPVSGTSLGDALGNSGITFTGAVTRFWIANAGNWSDTTHWSTSTGGASGASVPLPQDTVKIDANSFSLNGQTLTLDMPRMCKDLDETGLSKTTTLNNGALAVTMYGSMTLVAASSGWTNTSSITLAARDARTITAGGKSIGFTINIKAPGGTYTQQDNLSWSGVLNVSAGTWVTNGFTATFSTGLVIFNSTATIFGTFDASAGGNVSIGTFSASGVSALKMGSGTWTVSSTGTIWAASGTFTLDPGTSIIDITDASASTKTFNGGNMDYATLRYRSAGSGSLVFGFGAKFINLDLECTTARQITLNAGWIISVTGTLTLQGASGQLLTVASSIAGQQAGLWTMGTLVQSFTTLTSDVVLSGPNEVCGVNILTDAKRTAALSWTTSSNIGQTDGQTPPAGFGLHRGATNLFRRGQCDSTADCTANGAGTTISLDATTPPPFSTQSFKYVHDGSLAGQGGQLNTGTGQATATGINGVGSTYFKGVGGASYKFHITWLNTDASFTTGTDTTFTATGAWQLLTAIPLAVAAGKTGDRLTILVSINGTRAETFWMAHAMLETGQPFVAPYVPTTGGVVSSQVISRFEGPSSKLSQAGFWWAARLRIGFTSASVVAAAVTPNVACWITSLNTATTNPRVQLFYRTASGDWRMRISDGVSSGDAAIAQNLNGGEHVTVIGYCIPGTSVSVSVNGSAFTTTASALNPQLTEAWFDIGNFLGGNAGWIESDILWFAAGTGSMSNTDAVILNSYGDQVPSFSALRDAAKTTMIVPGTSFTYASQAVRQNSALLGVG